MSVLRWVLTDPYDTNPMTNTYTFPRNPEKMTSVYQDLAITAQSTLRGDPLLWQGATAAKQWTFSGPILNLQHLSDLHLWILQKERRLVLTDHFGRLINLVFTAFDAVPKTRVGLYYSHDYTISALIFSVAAATVPNGGTGMRDVPASIATTWRDGNYIGTKKPVARVTIQHPTMKLRNYSLMSSFTEHVAKITPKNTTLSVTFDLKHGQKVKQTYADFLFTTMGIPKELPNVKSVAWTRSVDTDVADCTVELWNTAPLPIGQTPRAGELDLPGYYTYSRGGSAFSSRWMHTRNEWFGMIVPDNIIRTYEGYGFDASLPPEQDPNLVQTGLWIIDSVDMTAAGTMSIKARDIGRILMDQMFYEPVTPKQFYDRGFQNWSGIYDRDPATAKLKITPQDSSNTPWVGADGNVGGHKLSYAFDGDPNTYWLSIGNVAPSRRFAYEWVQCKVNNQSVTEVRVRTKKKGYTAYISVSVGGVWQGSEAIDYHEDGIGRNGGDINYVASAPIDTEQNVTIKLPHAIAHVDAVRVTLGNLQNFKFGPYPYRGGIRDVAVYNTSTTTRNGTVGPTGSNPGRYSDYTDLIKLFCGWAGLFWPAGGRNRISNPTGTYYAVAPDTFDPVLGKGVKGRIWGDFQESGTNGPVPLDASNFDKKTLMECIGYVRDILGFVFFIDESGGAQWRFPNIQDRGCLATGLSANPGYRADYAHQIDEKSILMTLDCTIDSKNVRESIFVGDQLGKVGAFAPGFNPNPTGLRRIAGWTDAGFGNPGALTVGNAAQRQCELMADLISLRQLFTYRKDRIRIPANPAIQVDDQLRIFERTTAEGYLHYVNSIASSLDIETGIWTYDLDTHWLGFDPASRWIFKPEQLADTTRSYLKDVNRTHPTKIVSRIGHP